MDKITTDRDSLDFRDLLYRPSLRALPDELYPDPRAIRIRHQGQEGACAGFGLAAVIDFQNQLTDPESPAVSSRMLYEMGKRHDRWEGSNYAGTSARGVMKGWHKNGVCTEADWPYRKHAGYFTRKRAESALQTPLGAYYRVLPRRPDVHAALLETGAVFATAATHPGWEEPRWGRIAWNSARKPSEDDGHAFAIIGYTRKGFLIQNSWGHTWSKLKTDVGSLEGIALWTYADFDVHVWDLWVARRAQPVEDLKALALGWLHEGNEGSRSVAKAPPQFAIRDHYVHLDDGRFNHNGDYPSDESSLRESVRTQLRHPKTKRLLLYAHGGLNTVKASARRVEQWKETLTNNGIYGLHFIWETGLWAEFKDVLLGREKAARERVGGAGEWWDRFIETSTGWAGRAMWGEMQDGAHLAFSRSQAGGSRVLKILAEEWKALPASERPTWHLAGHSAGAIFMAHLLHRLQKQKGPTIESLTLMAPACTLAFYEDLIWPTLRNGKLRELHNFMLHDAREREDTVVNVYRKSLLYLVSNSYQRKRKVVPLLGMAKYLDEVRVEGVEDQYKFYMPLTHPSKTMATTHGSFDNDVATMNSLLGIVLGRRPRTKFTAEVLEG